MSDRYIRDYSYDEVQEMTDIELLKKLVNDSYTEEKSIEEDILTAKEESERADREVSRQRRKWDRLGEVRYMLENRCKRLGGDPHEGHYA